MKSKSITVCSCNSRKMCGHGCGYGLGVIGSAVYFISQATGFWAVVLALLKAMIWPAFVVYGLLKFLGL